MVRYNANGTIDTSFGTNGLTVDTIYYNNHINIRKEIRIKNNEKNKQNAIFIESREKLENLLKTIIRETHIKNMYWKPHILTG